MTNKQTLEDRLIDEYSDWFMEYEHKYGGMDWEKSDKHLKQAFKQIRKDAVAAMNKTIVKRMRKLANAPLTKKRLDAINEIYGLRTDITERQ